MVLESSEDKVKNTTSDTTGKDITNEVEVDKDKVKIYGINELVPSSAPITVPYLEIYRTNELEYIPYISPYNVGIQSSSDEETDTSSEDTSSSGDDTSSEDTSSSGDDTSSEDTSSSGDE